MKNCDRWGNYKKPHITYGLNATDSLPVYEYPYTEQNKEQADKNASAWSLTKIKLPSGGEIGVNYESDDYAYVQNKKAMQMFKIIHILQYPTASAL